MKMVFVTHLPPDAGGGAADRVRGLVSGLEAVGHTVHVLRVPIVGALRKVITSRRRPWWYITSSGRSIDTVLTAAGASDLAFLDYLPVAARLAPALAGRVPVIYGAHNDEVRLGRQHASAERVRAIADMQDVAVNGSDLTWVPGEIDRASLQCRHPDARIVNVPNGVSPLPDLTPVPVKLGTCFTYGSWEYEPNRAGLLRAAQARVDQPGGEAVVFGRAGREISRALQARESTSLRWTLAGFEPSWERMVTRGGGRAVVPLWSGGGTKLRVVQLAAMGVSTVVTSEAVSGLPAWLRRALPVYDDPRELLEQALFGELKSPEGRGALAEQVRRELSWEAVVASAVRESSLKLRLPSGGCQ